MFYVTRGAGGRRRSASSAATRRVVVRGLVEASSGTKAQSSPCRIELALDELAGDAEEERVEGREAVEEREDAALGEDARQRPKKLAHVLVGRVRVEEVRVVTRRRSSSLAGGRHRRDARMVHGTLGTHGVEGPRAHPLTTCHVSRLNVSRPLLGNASTRFSTSGCGSMTQCAAILEE